MPRARNVSPQTLRVLTELLDRPADWHYGYDLSRRTGLRSGTLYPILMRLAEQRWLETRWVAPEHAGRPARHVYRLTADGVRAASDHLGHAAAQRGGPGRHTTQAALDTVAPDRQAPVAQPRTRGLATP